MHRSSRMGTYWGRRSLVVRRWRTVAVESLEGRSLTSSLAVSRPVPITSRAAVDAPASVSAPTPDPGLRVVLTTDRSVYHRGQSVSMTLTETNASAQDVTLTTGPSANGFYVTRRGRSIWASN